jgi:hypothetical protein
VLAIIYFSLLFADIIAPYTKDFSDRNQSYAPPSKIFVINGYFLSSLTNRNN